MNSPLFKKTTVIYTDMLPRRVAEELRYTLEATEKVRLQYPKEASIPTTKSDYTFDDEIIMVVFVVESGFEEEFLKMMGESR